MKTANDLIKESEKKFKKTGILQIKKGTGKQQREIKNNSNSTKTKKTN